jgi:hypothetical protein
MSIGDVNSKERGSGARYNTGKPDWSLLPMHLLEGTVRVWMYGARKYAAWNWAKGMAWSVPYACILRHLFAFWWKGEENDPESGEHHLDHVICNVLMLKHFQTHYTEGDDRPIKEFKDSEHTQEEDDDIPAARAASVAAQGLGGDAAPDVRRRHAG